MSGIEVKQHIDQLSEELHEQLQQFILTGRVNEIMEEINNFRNNCPHEFVNGKCIYCGKKEQE